MDGKKNIGIWVLAVVTILSMHIAEPAKAEAFSLGKLIGGLLSEALGVDEKGIKNTYYDMVDNYYLAAYYSDKAAVAGAILLDRYGVAVRAEQVALVNSSSDSSDVVVRRTSKMKITTVDTSLTNLDQFVAVTERFDTNDELVHQFCEYKAIQEEALNRANSATALLVGKRLLTKNAGYAIGECIKTAIWYDNLRSRFADASGKSINLLNKAIKQCYEVKVDKKTIKEALENVPRG